MARKLQNRAKRGVKKAFSRLHVATKLLMVVALLAGLAAGGFVCWRASANDRFILKGQTSFSIDLVEGSTTPYFYAEEGVEAVCFGKDVTDKLFVETTLEKDAEGRYMIPTDKEGIYTITYTVDAPKFGEKAPNGQIKRVRVFAVTAGEEDGCNG